MPKPAQQARTAAPDARPYVRKSGPPSPIDPDKMLAWSYEELASKTGLPIGTLRRRVLAGTGPRLTLVGKHHRFLPRDVQKWLDSLRDATEAAQ